MTPSDELVRRYAEEARADRREALKYAKRHRALHVCIGLAAVFFGATAGSLGALEEPALSAIAGVLAAISAGAQTFLRAPLLARFHFQQAAEYGALARRFELLALSESPSAAADVQRLVDRWREVQARFPEDLLEEGASS